jgi:nucleotide-binding universal stress UspA family protein
MSIKSILCLCDGTPDEICGLNTSLALARAQAAQLRILHVTSPITPYMEGIVANSAISAAMDEENEERLKMARQYSSHYAALHHVPLDVADAPQHHASARFLHRTGSLEEIVSQEGRLSDLTVIGRNANGLNIIYDETLLAALFDTGRPVLVVPSFHGPLPREWEHKTIALPWNGSMEAARALYNAVPFLEEAEKVHVLIAHGHNEGCRITDEAGVLEYLQAHGVSADVIMVDRGSLSAGEALLAKAHELKADLMVMGAYGHTRAREMILGGVTHYMLKKADIPLLLSH